MADNWRKGKAFQQQKTVASYVVVIHTCGGLTLYCSGSCFLARLTGADTIEEPDFVRFLLLAILSLRVPKVACGANKYCQGRRIGSWFCWIYEIKRNFLGNLYEVCGNSVEAVRAVRAMAVTTSKFMMVFEKLLVERVEELYYCVFGWKLHIGGWDWCVKCSAWAFKWAGMVGCCWDLIWEDWIDDLDD